MGSNLPNFDRADYVQPLDPVGMPTGPGFTNESVDHAVFVKAITYGIGAAIVGSLLYALVGVYIHIGYIGLLVGYMIGKAMMMASDGLGGRKYQITAAVLTYFSISMAAVFEVLFQLTFHGKAPAHLTAALIDFIALYGVASPFLRFTGNVVSAVLNTIILVVAIRGAWREAKGTRSYEA